MKKFMSLTLALLMVLATLAGCGASAPMKENDMAMEARNKDLRNEMLVLERKVL